MLFEIQETVYIGSELRMTYAPFPCLRYDYSCLDVIFVIAKGTSVCSFERDVPESIRIAAWCVHYFSQLRDLTKYVSGSFR